MGSVKLTYMRAMWSSDRVLAAGYYEHKLLTPRNDRRFRLGWEWMHKRAKHSDAVMTGILVTKFKMGQIDVRDLVEMAADESKAEKCSAAKKVLEAVIDSSDHPTSNKP